MSKNAIPTYERFPLIRRIEHVTMLLSFTTLGLTGLPQKFPDSGVSIFFVNLLGGIEGLRSIHHAAAIIMMLGTIWHILYFGYISYVHRARLSMLPTLQDAKDALQVFMYNLGISKTFPQMGRYTFEEKMEYWAFVWGTAVMVATGFMMWNPISTAKFLPGEFIPAAKAAHGGEAVLAVLAIIIWHMYGVHIKRLNKSMFTGKMSEDDMLHEHPLELADIKAGIANRTVDPATFRKRQKVFFPVAGVLALLMLGGVYGFVNAEDTALETIERQIPTVEVYVPQTATPAPTQTPTLTPTQTPTITPTLVPTETSLPDATTVGTEQPASASAPTWDGATGALFQSKCGTCHGDSASGGLILTSYADALKGGDSGTVIVPGDSATSSLVTIQEAGGHFGQFEDEEIAQIVEWINAGALEK
jgi:cytochrome b subunit of formate dehydrogenase/mono/diheme cytochrome c family protein